VLSAGDQPQWGEAWSRNLVSSERNLPDSFDPVSGKNIKWTAKLGSESYATPIVANGRVYIGTNNAGKRDPKHVGDRGVLLCLDERDGKLLWQAIVPKRWEDPYFDWPNTGICSAASVENDRVYIVNNRGEVMCLDALGMANGNDGPFKDEGSHMTPEQPSSKPPKAGAEINPEPLKPPADGKVLEPGPLDADIIWVSDLVAGAGIWPHDAAHSSILIHGEQLYLNTGTGVDNTHKRIRAPDAPSLVVLDKKTGRLMARDDEHISPTIFHNTWSAPSLGVVDGRTIIFFSGGNGIVYGFEPLSKEPPAGEVAKLKKIFQIDFDPSAPKAGVHKFNQNRSEGPSNMYGMPVFADGKLFVAGGGDVFWGKNQSWLKCYDPRGEGDLTEKALQWTYALGKHTLTTAAVQDGLVYAADADGVLHCIDAKTGTGVWKHPMNGQFWASPLVADGKVYIGTRKGNFAILAAGREKKVLFNIELESPISATTTAANGVIYVATMKELFAIQMSR
jgi:outer membrane protein assembly factor BamB